MDAILYFFVGRGKRRADHAIINSRGYNVVKAAAKNNGWAVLQGKIFFSKGHVILSVLYGRKKYR